MGAPQGTKLAPILWLIYSNDLTAANFNTIKYADDTTFYKAITKSSPTETISSAVVDTENWANENGLILNTTKTVVMNISLNTRQAADDPVQIGSTNLTPATHTKFLGITIDSKLSFGAHVDQIVSKCNARIYLLVRLKRIGMSKKGLTTYYVTLIRPLLVYGATAWFSILSQHNKDRLEKIQRAATRIILPDISYPDRLNDLCLPSLEDYVNNTSLGYLTKIMSSENHPLHKHLLFNQSRTSSRHPLTFRPPRCRTQKFNQSFFNKYMSAYNDI